MNGQNAPCLRIIRQYHWVFKSSQVDVHILNNLNQYVGGIIIGF